MQKTRLCIRRILKKVNELIEFNKKPHCFTVGLFYIALIWFIYLL